MNCIQKAFKRTDLNKKKIVKMSQMRKSFRSADLLNSKKYAKMKKGVKKAAKKAAKQEVKKETGGGLRRQRRQRRVGPGRNLVSMEKRIVSQMKKNEGYRYPLANRSTRNQQEGAAPYHPIYGNGKRLEFEYLCRVIGRTGDPNTFSASTDGVNGSVSAVPVTQNHENYLFRIPIGDTVAYRYDQLLSTAITSRYIATSTSELVSNVFYTTETKSVPVANKMTDTMRYFDKYFVRKLIFKYSPSVPKTTAGNLVFAVKRDVSFGNEFDNIEHTYGDIASMPGKVETPVCEPCSFVAVKPWRLSQPMTGSPMWITHPVSVSERYQEDCLILAAVDTVLGANLSDKLGTLWATVVVDCYSETWTPNDMLSGTVAMQKSVSAPVQQSSSSSLTVTSIGSTIPYCEDEKLSEEMKEFKSTLKPEVRKEVDEVAKRKLEEFRKLRDSFVMVKSKEKVESKEEKKNPNA
jgi:hypothetical protein